MPLEENLGVVRSLNLVCGSVFWYHSDIMILQQSTRKLRRAARAKQWPWGHSLDKRASPRSILLVAAPCRVRADEEAAEMPEN
jgi:hypothetical protein